MITEKIPADFLCYLIVMFASLIFSCSAGRNRGFVVEAAYV